MDAEVIDRCREDPVTFAKVVLGVTLHPYQEEPYRHKARVKVVKGGRQVGKSYGPGAVTVLHHAFARPGSQSLIISAGEVSSKYLMGTIQRMAQGAVLLRGAVLDELKSELRFSNGSTITSVPASERQVRGRTVSCLVLDESRSIPESLFEAAMPTTLAVPDSEVWILSTPGGLPTGFFRRYFSRGMESPDEWCRAWWWPSSISPLVSRELVEEWQRTWDPIAFRREVLGEDVDEAECMFPQELVLSCLADWEPFTPADARRRSPYDYQSKRKELGYTVSVGIDWGTVRDGNVVAAVGVLDDLGANGPGYVYYLAHLDARYGIGYDEFFDVITDVTAGYHARMVVAESNGVGQYPSTVLSRRIREQGNGSQTFCRPTTAAIKLETFSRIHGLMCEGRWVMERRDDTVSQFCGLSREESEFGTTKIAGRHLHDDIPMAVLQAVRAIRPADRPPDEIHDAFLPEYEFTRTGKGTIVPRLARPEQFHSRSWQYPK
jgi:hypothetical protein